MLERYKKALEIVYILIKLPSAEYELFRILGFYVMNGTPELRRLIHLTYSLADRIRPRLIEMK